MGKKFSIILEKKRSIDRRFSQWLSLHYRQKRYFIITFSLIVLLSIYFFKDASFILRAVSAVAFVGFFYFVDHYWDIRFRWDHYLFMVIIAVASLLLSPLYYIHPQYDKLQHFFQPIFISSIIFYMVSKLDLRLRWKITFTVFVVIGLLTLFEFGEYALDLLFDWKLQGVYLRDAAGLEKFNLLMDPLDDTIYDLFLGTLGACVYGIITIIYFRFNRKKIELLP